MEDLIQYCRYYKGEEECPESYEKKLIDILRKQKASNSIYL